LRTKLTPFITSPKTLAMFLPILNTICDDFIDLIKYKRDTDNTVNNFQDLANLMGLEGKINKSSIIYHLIYFFVLF